MRQPQIPEQLLVGLTPEQRDAIRSAWFRVDQDAQQWIELAGSVLRTKTGQLWREDIAHWMADLLEIRLLIPDIYREWRPLLEDSIFFLISHLSAARLATKLMEQLELPRGTPTPFRLLALITRMPGLQKLGQVLARNRHLEPALRQALSQLENSISDVEFETIHGIIQQDLGTELRRIGAEVETSILSEATVSAVVRFRWEDGAAGTRHGVFKVLKPHIPSCFAEDMELFEELSEFLASQDQKYGLTIKYLPDTFREVRRLLEHEVNFAGEQKSLAEAARFYDSVPGVRVPRVIKSLCTRRITAMTEECGVKVTEASVLSNQRAAQLVRALVTRPLFASDPVALFHADPHAGNLLYNDETQELILLDWALVGHLTREQRRHMLMLTIMLAMQDPAGAAREITALSQDGSADTKEVLERIFSFLSTQPLLTLPRSLTAMQLMDSLAKQGVRFPSSLLIFRKAIFTLDGVLNDVGSAIDLDSFVLGYVLSHHPAVWATLFSLEDWMSMQASAMFYGSRIWMRSLAAW
jgi:ubiquinone biosynthesis protein